MHVFCHFYMIALDRYSYGHYNEMALLGLHFDLQKHWEGIPAL